jgi:hypothetical protein
MDTVWRETPTDIIENIARFVDDIDVRRVMGARPRKLINPPHINFPRTISEMWFREDGTWFAIYSVGEYSNRKMHNSRVIHHLPLYV